MAEHYKETPWYWYLGIIIFSFILGLIVVTKENITLPVWAYVVSLLLGIVIAPFVSTLDPRIANSNIIIEYDPLFSLRQRNRHK
jgi:hypothetical protein